MNYNRPRKTSFTRSSIGFTLIEMLVVIAIISLLLVLITAVVNQALDRAKMIKATSNLRQLGIGVFNHASDNNGRFPRGGYTPVQWHNDLFPYVGRDISVFRDPAGHNLNSWTSFQGTGLRLPFDFGYNPHINAPSGHPMAAPINRGPRTLMEMGPYKFPVLHTIYSQNNFPFWTFDLPADSNNRQRFDPRHRGRGIVLWSDNSVQALTYEEYMQMAKNSGGARNFVTGRR